MQANSDTSGRVENIQLIFAKKNGSMEHDRGSRRVQYLTIGAVSPAAVTLGVAFAWATPVLPMISRNEIGFPISPAAISWMVSISSIGFIMGSFVARVTSDKCGRRGTILISSSPMIIGTIIIIVAWEAWMLICGRLLWGIGTGMLTAVITVYIAEISDKDIRGRLSLSHRFMRSFGGLLVMTIGSLVSFHTLNYLVLALPVMFFVSCWWIPESPYYQLKQGKIEAAKQTLRLLTGIRDEDILEEKISSLRSQVQVEMKRSSSVKEFFTGKRYRKAIYIVIGIKIPQVMTGLHAILNYLGPILTASNSGINLTTAFMIFGIVRFVLGITSSALVDRLGRRPLLIGSYIGVGFFLSVIAVYFWIQDNYGTTYPYSLIPFIFIIFTIAISVLGYESVAYLIPSELFPMNVKSTAIAFTNVLGGVTNFLSVKSYQQNKDWINLSGVFGTFALAAFIGVAVSYFVVPETKGKSLKEIQIQLNGNYYEEEDKLNKVSPSNDKVDNKENVNSELLEKVSSPK